MDKEDQQYLKKDKLSNYDETPSLEDGWKESCIVPSGWMAKKDQQNLKKDKVLNTDETPSLEDGWKYSCNIPSGLMDKEDHQNLKKYKVSNGEESYSLEDGLDKPFEWNWEQEQCRIDKEKALLEEMKRSLKLLQQSREEEEKVINKISSSLIRLESKLSGWEAGSYHHDPGPEEEGGKSSLEDGWQESCDLSNGWMTKEKQQNCKEDKENCNIPIGWMRKEKQQTCPGD